MESTRNPRQRVARLLTYGKCLTYMMFILYYVLFWRVRGMISVYSGFYYLQVTESNSCWLEREKKMCSFRHIFQDANNPRRVSSTPRIGCPYLIFVDKHTVSKWWRRWCPTIPGLHPSPSQRVSFPAISATIPESRHLGPSCQPCPSPNQSSRL